MQLNIMKKLLYGPFQLSILQAAHHADDKGSLSTLSPSSPAAHELIFVDRAHDC